MIFIGGISNGVKHLFYDKRIYCKYCGERAEIALVMTYTCFTFFFIPLFRWNRRFFVEFACCRRQYELNPEIGMRILRGEEVEITAEDLELVGQGDPSAPRGYGRRSGDAETEETRGRSAAYRARCSGFDGEERPASEDFQAAETTENTEDIDAAEETASGRKQRSFPRETPHEKIRARAAEEEADQRYCPHCGEPIEVKFRYCPYCAGEL